MEVADDETGLVVDECPRPPAYYTLHNVSSVYLPVPDIPLDWKEIKLNYSDNTNLKLEMIR